MSIEELKYPIGKFDRPVEIRKDLINNWISDIAVFPQKLRISASGLTDDQLDTQYRPQGWTIRQVVHHCADSHMNSFIRFKLALTEDNPTIKPYYEDRWAELPDCKNYEIESSLQLLEGLHKRWSKLLRNISDKDFERTFIHPENNKQTSIAENIGIYAWHCNHHMAHIEGLKKRKDWN